MKRNSILGYLTVATILFSAAASASGFNLMEGMPGPWPFPWAEECPVHWENIQGRYILEDSTDGQMIEVKVTLVAGLNLKVVHMSRFGRDGLLVSDGYTWLTARQKSVRLWMYPMRKKDPPVWGVLKFHYLTRVRSCEDKMLVPILTLDQVDHSTHTITLYRLTKR